MNVYRYLHLYLYLYTYKHIHIYLQTYIYIYIYTYIYAYIHVYCQMYVYIYTSVCYVKQQRHVHRRGTTMRRIHGRNEHVFSLYKMTWCSTCRANNPGHWCVGHYSVALSTRCNALQRAATRCNTLQHTPAHCNTLSLTATRRGQYSVDSQHAIAQCNTLQHTAAHCNSLQHTEPGCTTQLQHTATHCNTLLGNLMWHTLSAYTRTLSTRCNTLQHAATRCYTLLGKLIAHAPPPHTNALSHTPLSQKPAPGAGFYNVCGGTEVEGTSFSIIWVTWNSYQVCHRSVKWRICHIIWHISHRLIYGGRTEVEGTPFSIIIRRISSADM